MGPKLKEAVQRAKRATKATGKPHVVIKDSWGEYTYERWPIGSERTAYWDLQGNKHLVHRRKNPRKNPLTAAEKNALIQYYRIGIDGLQRVKGKTIKSLMDKGYFTTHAITAKGKAEAKRLSDAEHESIMTRKNPKRKNPKRVHRSGTKLVRFYTDTDRYMGYVPSVNRDTYSEIRSWLLSGNKVVIGKYAYDKSDMGRIRKMAGL